MNAINTFFSSADKLPCLKGQVKNLCHSLAGIVRQNSLEILCAIVAFGILKNTIQSYSTLRQRGWKYTIGAPLTTTSLIFALALTKFMPTSKHRHCARAALLLASVIHAYFDKKRPFQTGLLSPVSVIPKNGLGGFACQLTSVTDKDGKPFRTNPGEQRFLVRFSTIQNQRLNWQGRAETSPEDLNFAVPESLISSWSENNSQAVYFRYCGTLLKAKPIQNFKTERTKKEQEANWVRIDGKIVCRDSENFTLTDEFNCLTLNQEGKLTVSDSRQLPEQFREPASLPWYTYQVIEASFHGITNQTAESTAYAPLEFLIPNPMSQNLQESQIIADASTIYVRLPLPVATGHLPARRVLNPGLLIIRLPEGKTIDDLAFVLDEGDQRKIRVTVS